MRSRDDLRKAGKFGEADGVRKKLEGMGYEVSDTKFGTTVKRRK